VENQTFDTFERNYIDKMWFYLFFSFWLAFFFPLMLMQEEEYLINTNYVEISFFIWLLPMLYFLYKFIFPNNFFYERRKKIYSVISFDGERKKIKIIKKSCIT
jgi:hypothetical protein